MKKLYKDIRLTKSILVLWAGILMAGCSAEDELGNNSAAQQQLSITPLVNDLQNTRVKEEENLKEKDLLSLDFKMFNPESGLLQIDKQYSNPAVGELIELGASNWKVDNNLQEGKKYDFYAIANAKDDLKGKSLADLKAATQEDDDIWKPYPMATNKKFLMSCQDAYTITKEATQNIPVQLVRAAAKIKLNLSSSVKGYNIKDVKWKLTNYNVNTTLLAGETATPKIIKDNETWNEATPTQGTDGNNIANSYAVTTYSYATTWANKDDMPYIVTEITFVNTEGTSTVQKTYNIPVRDPQGDNQLARNFIYTINAEIKYLDTKTIIDYNDDKDYLKWAITKWTQGEDTYVNADGSSYLVVYPTSINIKGGEDNEFTDKSIQWFASNICDIKDKYGYYIDKSGKEKQYDYGQIKADYTNSVTDSYRGWIDIHAGNPQDQTIVYSTFTIYVPNTDKEQMIHVKKYPSIYSMNVKSEGTNDEDGKIDNRLYTVQFANNKRANGYTIAKPKLDSNNKSTDNTVSPAFIIASISKSKSESVASNEEAREYCKNYTETATTRKNERLELKGWRLPTKEEVKLIHQLQNYDKAIGKNELKGEYYWTLDGGQSERYNDNPTLGTYVRCVHDLTLDEIEKIENQGF